MSELTVEPVESIDDADVPVGVDAPKYVLYGGKGGVGKTTMAAATALASARDGTATLVVSTDPAHSLSDTFETKIAADPARIRDDVPLYGAEIDPDAAMEDGMFGQGGSMDGMGGLGELLSGDEEEGNPLMGGTMPGADEAAAMRLLLQYMDDERFERVVIDTAPTGHTLRLLELPEVLDSMVGRFIKLRQRFSGMMDGLKGMFGEGQNPEDGIGDLEEFAARIERLRETLRDPSQTDFRIVMVPEEMSVVESQRLLSRLTEFKIPVGTVVVNQVMENLTDVTGIETDWFVSPSLDSCEFCQRRWKVQQNALTKAQDLFMGHTVKRVPLFADEVRGEQMLRVVAACLD